MQLTFTCLDSGTWQVAQLSDGATDQMREIMLAGAETTLDPHVEMSLLPTEEELLLERPRRLVHRPFQGDLSALWHTTPAGVDASGVPGNLFLHAALELAPGAPDPTRRAIDAWRSPLWSTPWNFAEVQAARFDEVQELPPGPLAGPEAAMRFLDRPGLGVDALGPLLDAIAETLEGGPNVALIADTPDDGAAWIAVLSHLLSQTTAARLSWSTYERAATVDPVRGFPLNLCVFPPVDEDALDEAFAGGSDFALIKAHAGAAAHTGVLSPWALMAQDFRHAPVEARVRVLRSRDDLVAESPDRMPIHPARPLADAIRGDEFFATEWVVEDDEPIPAVVESAPPTIPAAVDSVATPAAIPVAVHSGPASVTIPGPAAVPECERRELTVVGAPAGDVGNDHTEPRGPWRPSLSRRRSEKNRLRVESAHLVEPNWQPEPGEQSEPEGFERPHAVPKPQPESRQVDPPSATPPSAPPPPIALPEAPPEAPPQEPPAPRAERPEPGSVATIAAPRVSIETLPEKPDLERLWHELRAGNDMTGPAAVRYVHIALLDRDCLFEAVPAAAPISIRWEAGPWADLTVTREALLADAATWHVRHEPADAAVRVLRLVDFLVRARAASDRPDGPVADRIVDLVRVHLPALMGVGGLEVQRRCGDLDGRTRFGVLQEAIWASTMPPHSFRDPLHLWLGISCWTRYPLR